MKKFILKTLGVGLLIYVGIGVAFQPALDHWLYKLAAASVFLALASYYAFAIVEFRQWLKASPDERERIKYEDDKRKERRIMGPKQWGALAGLALIIVMIGVATHWNSFYVGILVLWLAYAGFHVISQIPDIFFDWRHRWIRERNAKRDPVLLGPAEAPPGEIALGWVLDKDRETFRRTSELKTASQSDRNSHFYIVGASGMGKTKLLEALILQDAKNRQGFGVIDPHGDLIEEIKIHLAYTEWPHDSDGKENNDKEIEASERFLMERVVLVDPTDRLTTACFNPLELYPGVPASELSGELVMIFKKIWADSWGPRLEDLLRNSFIALAEAELTLCDLPEFLIDENFRRKTLSRVHNEICRSRFKQFEAQSAGAKNVWIEPVLNKINALLTDDRLRQLFSAPKSTFDLRDIIDSGKILLVKLDKGRLKGSADLLGSLIVSKIQMAAFSRTDTKPEQRRPFYLYIDEFQNFATEHFLETLAEARKYRLHLILAHQNLSQLSERLQAAILTNSGLQIYFRTSHQDARVFARESSEAPAELSERDKRIGRTNPLYDNKRYELKGQRWADREQMLKDLPPRWCILKNKKEDGAVLIKTDKIPDPLADASEAKAQEWRELADSMIGASYLRKREDLERQGRERVEESAEPEEPETFRESKSLKF